MEVIILIFDESDDLTILFLETSIVLTKEFELRLALLSYYFPCSLFLSLEDVSVTQDFESRDASQYSDLRTVDRSEDTASAARH